MYMMSSPARARRPPRPRRPGQRFAALACKHRGGWWVEENINKNNNKELHKQIHVKLI